MAHFSSDAVLIRRPVYECVLVIFLVILITFGGEACRNQ
jgi:hypothetical protein